MYERFNLICMYFFFRIIAALLLQSCLPISVNIHHTFQAVEAVTIFTGVDIKLQ